MEFFSFLSNLSRFKKEVENKIILTSWIGFHILPIVIFGVAPKPPCSKASRMHGWWIVKEHFWTNLATCKRNDNCFHASLVFDNPLSKYLSSKRVSWAQRLFSSDLPKLNSGLKLVSGAHFSHIFPWTFSLYNTLSIDQVTILNHYFLHKIPNRLF